MQSYQKNQPEEVPQPGRRVDDEYNPPLNDNWEEMTIDEVIAGRYNAHGIV